jgi:hypothetical protein
MKPQPLAGSTPNPAAQAGNDIRHRVERLGSTLAETLAVVLSEIPGRGAGPQMLANAIGITVATASRLLKALTQEEPISVIQLLPGPNPLRSVVQSAKELGAGAAGVAAALVAIEEFDSIIRTEAGDRSAFKAMLSTWLPEERREFQSARRRTIFKAMTELEGVSAELDLNCIALRPSELEGHLDLLNLTALLGIDRIRPDARVKLSTHVLIAKGKDGKEGPSEHRSREPRSLSGDPISGDFGSGRLDDFCTARPAPLEVSTYGNYVRYTLGPTGFGPSSTVDLVLGELNTGELRSSIEQHHEAGWSPYFFQIPDMPVKLAVFDLIIFKGAYTEYQVEFVSHRTSERGPADVNDPGREFDQIELNEPLKVLGAHPGQMRIMEFPRYTELLRHSFEKLGWDSDEFTAYRIRVPHPLAGTQMTFKLTRKES